MQATSLKVKIIEEINLIPENKLEQLYQIVHLFRLGLERLNEMTFQIGYPIIEDSTEKDLYRIPDLHPGAIIMHDGFDDELPDEFWFGDDVHHETTT
jgi:hypothetical protein